MPPNPATLGNWLLQKERRGVGSEYVPLAKQSRYSSGDCAPGPWNGEVERARDSKDVPTLLELARELVYDVLEEVSSNPDPFASSILDSLFPLCEHCPQIRGALSSCDRYTRAPLSHFLCVPSLTLCF